jgi:hypothetical protein
MALIVLLMALGTSAQPEAASQGVKQPVSIDPQAQKLQEQLQEISPYIRTDETGRQKLQQGKARRAGVPEEAIELGQNVVVVTNRLHDAAINSQTIAKDELDLSFLEPLFKAVAVNKDAGASGIHTQAWYSCMGFTNYPDPCPPRWNPGYYFSSQSAVTNFLLRIGYHKTSGYACNNNPNDYSVVVWSSCGWGTFRNQALVKRDGYWWTFSLQGPEPNPEIISYVWPVPWWGSYVWWWHHYYC